MRIVQSYRSRGNDTRGGWESVALHYYSWVISCFQARKQYGNINLVSDSDGANLLVDKLKLPYDSVDTSLDSCNVDSTLWSYNKIWAFGRQNVPFIHIDSDVFLWKRLPDNFPIIIQNKEDPHNLEWYRNYIDRKGELEVLPHKPPFWKQLATGSYNFGVFGGHDLKRIHNYVAAVNDLVRHPKNQEAWKSLGNLSRFSWLVEQGIGYAVLPESAVAQGSLFHYGNHIPTRAVELGYTHLMIEKGSAIRAGIASRIVRRMKEGFPEQYDLIGELLEPATHGYRLMKLKQKPLAFWPIQEDIVGNNDILSQGVALQRLQNHVFSVEVWVRLTTKRHWFKPMGCRSSDPVPLGWNFYSGTDDGNWQAWIGDGKSNWAILNSKVKAGSNYLALTYDGSIARFYVDGVLRAMKTCSYVEYADSLMSFDHIYSIRNAAYFDRVLSPEEIYQTFIQGTAQWTDLTIRQLSHEYPNTGGSSMIAMSFFSIPFYDSAGGSEL